MATCIYCGRIDPPLGFTREHVLPAAFGTFKNDLTLLDSVCGDCNQYLGDHLDRVLSRDSVEAVLRLYHGLKEPATMRGMFKDHVRVRLPRDGTMWGGAHVELTAPPAGRGGLGSRPLPQVGFKRRDETGWDYFTESELRDAGDLRARFETEWEPEAAKHVVAPTQEIHERLMALMRDHGVPLKGMELEGGITPEGLGNADVAWTFDVTLARAIAKVAFNYLAKTQGAEFAHRHEFDAVRRFIREGVGNPPYFVQPQEGPIVEHRFGGDPPRCHVITLYWGETRPEIICRLSPFNHHAYLVRLCIDFRGPLWREVKSGHLFDLETREARELHKTPIMPPEGWAF